MAQGGDVFVLDMGKPVRIVDLARRMVEPVGHDGARRGESRRRHRDPLHRPAAGREAVRGAADRQQRHRHRAPDDHACHGALCPGARGAGTAAAADRGDGAVRRARGARAADAGRARVPPERRHRRPGVAPVRDPSRGRGQGDQPAGARASLAGATPGVSGIHRTDSASPSTAGHREDHLRPPDRRRAAEFHEDRAALPRARPRGLVPPADRAHRPALRREHVGRVLPRPRAADAALPPRGGQRHARRADRRRDDRLREGRDGASSRTGSWSSAT